LVREWKRSEGAYFEAPAVNSRDHGEISPRRKKRERLPEKG